MKKHTRASLLSPMSPVSSPETADVLQKAERLVQSAQKQIMEVSYDSALNTLDENHSSYVGQQPLDDSMLYVREIVDSKFQESNDPNGIYTRKVLMNNAASSNRKLQHDQFPVKESNRMLNKPLQISEQNSAFSTNHMAKEIFLENEKPFFKKAPNWYQIKPPEHIHVFPTFTTSNLKCKTKSSCTVPRCTVTNTGVIEINGRDHLNGTIQVQTGPTVDIQRGLTIQTIENVHISPNPSSVPIYNNIATYCFQHEPSTSTSFADSNRTHLEKHSITSSTARNVSDTRKERHIQSTEYNNMQKKEHIEDTHNAETSVIKDSISPSHDIIGEQAMVTNDSEDVNNHSDSNKDNVNCNEIDLSSARNRVSVDSNVSEDSNLDESSISDKNLRTHRIVQELIRDVTDSPNLKKAVSIKITPMKTSVYEEFPVTDAEVQSENEEQDSRGDNLSRDHYETMSNIEFPKPQDHQKFHHVQSDKDYVRRSQACGNECRTGSCSKKCERDVEYREKQRLKEALETIANIQKLRFDLKDTGITLGECTQICDGKNYCNADAVNFEFEPFSEPERFKTALENLCKFSQNTKASKIDTNSKIYKEGVDAFVKMFFDPDNQSNPVQGLYSTNQNSENKTAALRQNKQFMSGTGTVENAKGEKRKEDVSKTLKQVKLIPEQKKMEYRQGSSRTVKSTVNNSSTIKYNSPDSTMWQKKPSKYSKPPAPQNSLSVKGKTAQQEKASSEMISNEEGNALENLDLKQPCVSDFDAVLKTYRESMAAICQGTEQLSQLISHHIMQNAMSTSDQISSQPVPNCPIILGKTEVEPYDVRNERASAEPVLNLGSYSPSKIPGQFDSVHEKNCTAKTFIQTTCSNQIQSTKVNQQEHGRHRVPRCNYPSVSRDDLEFSNENNSVCTNETPVSTRNERSSTSSKSPSEQAESLSNTNENSSHAQLNVTNGTSNSTSNSEPHQQSSVNIKSQSVPTKHRDVKSVRKSNGNQFNVQYCMNEPFEASIPIEVTSDKKSSPSQSGLSTYIHLENACGKDMRLRRHSNYDIHGDQTGDFNLYKCPVLNSGQRNNVHPSNNDSDDKLAAAERVTHTKEIELRVFGQILDAAKNSSQLMKQVVVSLFSGMEIDSIKDIIRNLEAAAVHPIVIEQLSVILKEKNKHKSLFGGNLTNQATPFDGWQKNYNEATDLPKTNDNMNSFKHSTAFNGGMVTTNIHSNKADQDPAVLDLPRNEINKSLDPLQHQEMNFEVNKDCVNSIYNRNSPNKEVSKDKSPSGQVQCEMILEEHIMEGELKHSNNNLAVSKTSFEKKSPLSEPSLKLPGSIFQVLAAEDTGKEKLQQDCQEAKGRSLETAHCQNTDATLEGRSNVSECLTNSTSGNASSKKNDSESNTDNDISFVIPHDTDANNEIVDLSSAQKLTSVTLKNVNTGQIIKLQIESNSVTQERGKKINSDSDNGQSSVATKKSNIRLQNSNKPLLNHENLTKTPQKDDKNIKCHCRRAKDHDDHQIESHHLPCESSMDAVNVPIDLQIQTNYKEPGLLNSGEIAVHHISDKTTSIDERTVNKRPGSSVLRATSKSPMRKVKDSAKSGGNKKKSFDKKVSVNRKVVSDNKQRSVNGAKNNESSDSEKSDLKNVCPLCIQLQGKCSCLDCTNHIRNLKRHNKISPKSRTEREKPIKNTKSLRQSGSPKRLGHTAGKYGVRKELNSNSKELNSNSKELSFRSTPVLLESGNDEKLVVTRTLDDAASTAHKIKLKPSSGMLSSDSHSNDGPMNLETRPGTDRKLLQDAASDSNNLEVKNKSQNTVKPEDVTISKSTETQATDISVCKSSITLCNKVPTFDKGSLISPRKLEKIAEVNTVHNPSVKEAGTLPCLESCSLTQDSSTDYRNTHYDKTNITEENIMGCTEMKDPPRVGSQASAMSKNFQEYQTNLPETISDPGTVPVFKTTCPNIFEDESIIVLQPLSELDHTFFIARPNCAEKKIIQEKLNKRLNLQVREIIDDAYSAVYELDQHHKETNKDSNREIVEHVDCIDRGTSVDTIQLNNATSPISCVKNEECQASCLGGTGIENPMHFKRSSVTFAPTFATGYNASYLENMDKCTDLCTSDDECLRVCPQPPPELDDSIPHCKQDCPNDEVCLKLCSQKPDAEPSAQTSLININLILEKFIAENNVPNVKWPTVKGLIEELKKVADSLRPENETLGTIYEKSESQKIHDKTEIKNAGCNAAEGQRKSVQYEEPHEKMEHIMMNRKSLVLPNVVRPIADMHPSRKLENFRFLSADPLVSGNFNKPESDRKYSVFNRTEPGRSSIDLKDPRTQAYLNSIGKWTKVHEDEKPPPDNPIGIVQSTMPQIPKKTSAAGKSNNNNKAKLNKSRPGMDADFDLLVGLNKRLAEHDNNSMKSFESSDLEPGQFLDVRTPFDNPIKSCQRKGRIDLEIGQVSQDQTECNSLRNNDENHLRSVINVESRNMQETTKKQHRTLENKYELSVDSAEAAYMRKEYKSNPEELVNQSETISLHTIKPIANGAQPVVGKSDPMFGAHNLPLVCDKAKNLKYSTDYFEVKSQFTREFDHEGSLKAENFIRISESSFGDVKSNTLKAMEKDTAFVDFNSSKINNSDSSKVVRDSHVIIDEKRKMDRLHKYSEQLVNATECSNRPRIIDHFLGKTKLEDLKINYTNNKTDTISKESQSLGGNCQRLYLKSDFTSKTTPESENGNIMESPDLSVIRDDVTQFNFSSRTLNERDFTYPNQTTSKRWDQTSSDAYSEGEINLPSSCSYSLGEVKISTPSSITAGKSFKDPDGLTIFVTKSILDSVHAGCTSPGEILAEIHKTETDSSSSIS